MASNGTTSTMRFVECALFGGAIRADLPETFFDASKIREIPDHQEVYLDRDGFSSITFDILERVMDTPTDNAALVYHLSDLIDGKDRVCITDPRSAELPGCPVPARSLIASTKPIANKDGGKDFTILLLLLIRLEMQTTDILVSVNLPYRGQQFTADVVDLNFDTSVGSGVENNTLELGLDMLDTIRRTFQILDWGLFGED